MSARARPLRTRLLLFAGGITAAALVATWFGLNALFSRHLERRVSQELDTHLAQLAGGLRVDDAGALTLFREPADPRFGRVYGGLYWQASDLDAGEALRSRSLFDAELALPADTIRPGAVHVHVAEGPAGERLIVHEQRILLPVGPGDHEMRLAVAIDRAELDSLEQGFARDLAPALGLLGLVLVGGFAAQIGAALRPFAGIRSGIADIAAGHSRRLPGGAPAEIAPLVDEVNALLDAKEADIARARDRAADLAHGLKTPLTALAADIARLRARGETAIADDIDMLAGRMRRHMERELARARMRHGRGSGAGLAPAVDAVLRTLARTPDGERVVASSTVPAGLAVALDPDDLAEIVGNIAENGFRHARARLDVSAAAEAGAVRLHFDDDGPGLSEPDRAAALERGRRLDEKGDGAGLGLAIVSDIAAAAGGQLALDASPLGGLRAVVTLPAA